MSGDIVLRRPGSANGQILALDVLPDNLDAQGGYYSYRDVVGVFPGWVDDGVWEVGFAEVATG